MQGRTRPESVRLSVQSQLSLERKAMMCRQLVGAIQRPITATRSERGEANEILPCKLRSAHHFSQRLIKMFRTPWRNVAKCGYRSLSAVVKHKKIHESTPHILKKPGPGTSRGSLPQENLVRFSPLPGPHCQQSPVPVLAVPGYRYWPASVVDSGGPN